MPAGGGVPGRARVTAVELLPVHQFISPGDLAGRGLASDLPDAPGIAARRRATAFGKDAYPSLDAKAAALLHSLARGHALTGGNKRLALAAVIAVYGLNGRRLTLTSDQARDLVMKVAAAS